MSKENVEKFGWNAVPRNRSNVPSSSNAKTESAPVDFNTIWPKTAVVRKAQDFVKQQLTVETYNHSLRVFCYGHIIVNQHFPSWIASEKEAFFETWALTCLFHDLATTEANRAVTHLSFEFQGGFIALEQLQVFGAPRAQAEGVCEAIIRHQDPGETGTITRMGQLAQIATEFGMNQTPQLLAFDVSADHKVSIDNVGWQPWLVHRDVIEQAVQQHPRLKWSGCFSSTIHAEIDAKPWCHTTVLDGFAEAVAGNKLMEPYD